MLIDPLMRKRRDPLFDQITAIIGGSNDIEHPRKGFFIISHWNFDGLVSQDLDIEKYPDLGEHDPIGVCDRPEQLLEKYPFLETSARQFFVSFVKIAKKDQSPDGGWRWHKWGSYIGDHEITAEYLYDEPVVEEVYTFHIYEMLNQ